jgi:hypothetical protein
MSASANSGEIIQRGM